MADQAPVILPVERLGSLIEALRAQGYRVIGPTVRSGAVVYDELRSADELPRGIGDEQDAGRYRLRERADGAFFGQASSPQSWRQFFQRPQLTLLRIHRDGAGFNTEVPARTTPPLALFGAHACDLAAVAVQDRVLMQGAYVDPNYAAARDGAFVVAVNCSTPSSTCFCASMNTGPRATSGFDLALTEILDEPHRFFVEIGSERGRQVLEKLAPDSSTAVDAERADAVVSHARQSMGRQLDIRNLPARLAAAHEHPRWDDVADRCLSCTNCTLVCPTCFCTTIEDVTSLDGQHAERRQRWDSCFTLGHSHLPHGSVRSSRQSRYRQWLTHKLGTWEAQFGTIGCVGCGRCITFCPAAIDIVEEAVAVAGPTGG